MGGYYDRLGDILKDRLNSDEDPFETWSPHNGKTRSAGNIKERRPKPPKNKIIKKIKVPIELHQYYLDLELEPGMPFNDCKKQWKILLKKNHPDLFNSDEKKELQGDRVRKINNAYNKLKVWFETGSYS